MLRNRRLGIELLIPVIPFSAELQRIAETIETIPEVANALEVPVNTAVISKCRFHRDLLETAVIESLPVRHTVWTAEKLRQIALTIARNRPNSAIRTLKLD